MRLLVLAAVLGIVTVPFAARAQAADSAFVTGTCPKQDGVPDLSTVVSTPDSAPTLRSRPPQVPTFARQRFYRGRVVLAVVVDTTGRAERGSATVMESTDARLSAWICSQVRGMRFRPAYKDGRRVRAQMAMPLQYIALQPGRRPFPT